MLLLSISTIVYLYLIPHTHSIPTLLSTLEIDCISVTSDNSDTNDDDLVSVTCSDAGAAYSNYIVTSCGYYAPWKNSDGSYLSNNICYAQNGLSGDYILAVAQCCDIRNYVSSCNVYESSSYSGFNEGDTITQQCSSVNDEYLISCSSSTNWNNIEGYHAEDTVDDKALIEQQSCTAMANGQSTSNDPHGVKVHSHCCSMKSDYILECHQVVGDKSGGFDDSESYTDCDVLDAETHWFISSCHRYTDGGLYLDSIYIDAQRCVVTNGNGNSVGSVAVAQCCSIGFIEDDYEMITMSGSYKCEKLTENIDIIYDIDYDACLDKCLIEYNEQCKMINHITKGKTTSDSRCYIFDKYCDIYNDVNSGNLVAMKGFSDKCMNHPLDWTDIYGDDCDWYKTYHWCSNGSIHSNITQETFINHEDDTYGLNAIQTCCDCGGGLQMFDDIKLMFSKTFNANDSVFDLCEWHFGDPNQYDHVNGGWNTFHLFQLCMKLKDKIMEINDYIDCGMLIDNSYSKPMDITMCDFESTTGDELYFVAIFDIDINQSAKIYLNYDWFNMTQMLQTQTHEECMNTLSMSLESTFYGIFPCDIITTSPTSDPTVHPTTFPTIQPDSNDVNVDDETRTQETESRAVSMLIVFMILLFVAILALVIYMYRNKEKEQKIDELQTEIQTLKSGLSKTSSGGNMTITNNDECILCVDSVANMFNYPCGHVSYCSQCSVTAIQTNNKCPNCRETVQECIPIYSGGFKPNYTD